MGLFFLYHAWDLNRDFSIKTSPIFMLPKKTQTSPIFYIYLIMTKVWPHASNTTSEEKSINHTCWVSPNNISNIHEYELHQTTQLLHWVFFILKKNISYFSIHFFFSFFMNSGLHMCLIKNGKVMVKKKKEKLQKT